MNQHKTIEDLRAVLFETIASVRDGSMPLDRANAVSDLAQVMVNSAKVEVEFARATGAKSGTGFLEQPAQLPAGITGITQHRIR